MRVGNFSATQSFDVLPDPRIDTTQEEFDELNRFLLAVRDEITSTHETVFEIRDLRSRVELQTGESDDPAVREEGARVARQLEIIEEKLIQFRAKATQDLINYPVRLNDKLSTLFTLVETSDSPPAKQDYELFDDLKERIQVVIGELDEFIDTTEWSKIGMEVN